MEGRGNRREGREGEGRGRGREESGEERGGEGGRRGGTSSLLVDVLMQWLCSKWHLSKHKWMLRVRAYRCSVVSCVTVVAVLSPQVCSAVSSMATGCTVGAERGVSEGGTSLLGRRCSL